MGLGRGRLSRNVRKSPCRRMAKLKHKVIQRLDLVNSRAQRRLSRLRHHEMKGRTVRLGGTAATPSPVSASMEGRAGMEDRHGYPRSERPKPMTGSLNVAELEESPRQAARSISTRIRMLLAIWASPVREDIVEREVRELRKRRE